MQNSYNKEHYIKQLYYLAIKHDWTSAQLIFHWNTQVAAHKQGNVGFP